ncbi:MAG: putative 4-phosphopantetheinyl transferase HetI [Gammaproteobacteria bacterium]|nr:putative 4-phosphopantetheinyl transferase HetI [Gammaproteobacteria bacterium]
MVSDEETLVSSDANVLTRLSTPLRAEPNTVHVWAFTLEAPPECIELCRSWLSDDERARADRFVFEHHRVRHTVAHGVLRRLLSLYCDATPESLQFTASGAGKPALRPDSGGAPAIDFNLTHSETRGAIGVSSGLPLGIDLEQLRTSIEALSISSNYFFGSERQAIESAPAALREATFFRYWVAKEAVLKAEGIGLGFPLDRFRVDFLPGESTARIETLDPDALGGDWTARMLPCEPGWLAAVAARGSDWKLRLERPLEF